jgi:hypothetical protein
LTICCILMTRYHRCIPLPLNLFGKAEYRQRLVLSLDNCCLIEFLREIILGVEGC